MKLKFSNKSWIVLSTTIIIGFAFSIYFLVYVKGKERDMIANNFRVLQQIVKNIRSLESSFKKNADIRSITMKPTMETNNDLKIINALQKKEVELLAESSEKEILYGKSGIYFKVDIILNPQDRSNSGNYYFTDYNDFFNNELFLRKDIFEQIIIFKSNLTEKGIIDRRDVLFSNESVGIMDSTFYQKSFRLAKDEININDENYISFNQRIDSDSNIIISGLVLKSSFERQKRSVSPFVIFILSTALVLIILAMPLLKLKIMSLEERLHSKDVIFIVISVLIGPPIFLIFSYTSIISFGVQKTEQKEMLKSLSQKIENNFDKEMGNVIEQMDSLNNYFSGISRDSKIENDTLFKIDELSEDFLAKANFTDFLLNGSSNKIKGYRVYSDIINSQLIPFKHLKLFFWITKNAEALIFLSVFNNPGYAQNLSHRKYITNITNDKASIFNYSKDKNFEIAIESIKSVNDGSYEVGIGKSTGGSELPVMAVSMKMASTMGTILEEGYGFCILDNTGNTMFHSEITKNMNENFINETSQTFLAAIESHASMYQTVSYNGIDQMIYFRPLDNLSGHYIATFVNIEVQDAPFTLSMITGFIMFLGYLFLVLVISPLLYFSNFKLTKLKQNIKIFNFVRPYETDDFFKKYKLIIAVSIIIIVYLIFSMLVNADNPVFIISELVLVILLFLVCTLYSLSIGLHAHYHLHSGIRKPSKAGYTIAIYFFLSLFILKLAVIIWTAQGFLIITNGFLGLVLSITIVRAVFYEKIKFSFLGKPAKDSTQIQQTYKHMIMLWVIIFSIIPINLFLHISTEKEDEIFAKYRSLQLGNKIEAWGKNNRNEFRDKFADSKCGEKNYQLFVNSMAEDSINFALTESKVVADARPENELKDSFFDRLYKYFRPNYNERSEISSGYILNHASDTRWTFHISNNKNILTVPVINGNTNVASISVEMPRNVFLEDNWFLVLVIICISMFILYSFMNFILIKVYGFNYKIFADKIGVISAETFHELFLADRFFSNKSSYNNIFIVGVNTAHLSFIKDYFKKSPEHIFVTLDFYDFSEAPENGKGGTSEQFELLKKERFERDWKKVKGLLDNPNQKAYVLVEHFEFGYNDLKMNKLKLEVLKYLVDCENFKLLVKSEINATKVLDCYEDNIKRTMNILKKAGADKQVEIQNLISELKIDYKKWQHLLGSFVKCIIPINIYSLDPELENQNNSNTKRRIKTGEELVYGEFLNMLNHYIKDKTFIDLPDEDKILTIQQMSYPYYFSLWNALSKDERYIVYDIANDRYVNTVNSSAIFSLLSKGILVYDHSLRLMNESFAEFVLTKVNYEEALEMELESRKKGSWNTALAVILLLIISLVIFLSIGQQSFLNDLNSFITAIAALLGLLIRFSGFLSFGGSKSIAD